MTIKITKRDLKLFEILFENGGLSTSQIQYVLTPHTQVNTILRRLRKLEEAGFLEKLHHLSGYERIWILKKKGALEIGRPQVLKRAFNPSTIQHDLLLNDLRFWFYKMGVKRWVSDVQIRSQLLSKKKKKESPKRLIPDALFVVEDASGVKRSVALELELTAKSSKRYGRIFKNYGQKENLYALWYLVATEGLGKKIQKVHQEKGLFNEQGLRVFYSVLTDFLFHSEEAFLHDENGQKVRLKKLFFLSKRALKPRFLVKKGLPRVNKSLPMGWAGCENDQRVSSHQNDLENRHSEEVERDLILADHTHPPLSSECGQLGSGQRKKKG